MSRRVDLLKVFACGLIGWLVVGCTDSGAPDPAPSGSAPPSVDAAVDERPGVDPYAAAWHDVTDTALGPTAGWSNMVEAADIDTDGDVDLLFANSGDDSWGTPVANQVFLNNGDGTFTERTRQIFGRTVGIARVIRVADLNADKVPDIVVGNAHNSQSRLYLGNPSGGWRDVTESHLPAARLSVSDLELGDVDADGDLDMALADWGRGSPEENQGAKVRLWLNDGSGRFADATATQMPDILVRFSWHLELVDVDNDWDLDIATSCKLCESSALYDNDGGGTFTDVTEQRMPHFTNNYELTALDLDGDGYLDLVTVNDGDDLGNGPSEHVFRNDRAGGYVDATAQWWPPDANQGWDDNVVGGLDIDSDGDADFVIGSLDGPDRLLVNDGTGALTVHDSIFDSDPTYGTLGIAFVDLDGDNRIDIVESQGEAEDSMDERVYLATDRIPPDTAPPVIRGEVAGGSVVARVHDNLTPNKTYGWQDVVVRSPGGDIAMVWYGENLFRAATPPGTGDLEVCATDSAGNETCAPIN